jgi:hypothetical protein
MPFKQGQSGNPAGRPRGSRNKRRLPFERMLEGEGNAILRKAIELAKDGDSAALRICIERLVPRRTHERVACLLPPMEKAADSVGALAALSAAVGVGSIAPSDAAGLSKVLDVHLRALATREFDERLSELEARANDPMSPAGCHEGRPGVSPRPHDRAGQDARG